MHSMHSALPTCQPQFMVRSLQLVEVRPYAEEEVGKFWVVGRLPTWVQFCPHKAQPHVGKSIARQCFPTRVIEGIEAKIGS